MLPATRFTIFLSSRLEFLVPPKPYRFVLHMWWHLPYIYALFVSLSSCLVPQSLQVLMRGSNQRARDRQRYRLSYKHRREDAEARQSTSSGGGSEKAPPKLSQLRSHKAKMAIVRNPAKLAQIKKQMAQRVWSQYIFRLLGFLTPDRHCLLAVPERLFLVMTIIKGLWAYG